MITPEVQAAIERDIASIRSHASPGIGDRWYRALIRAIASLASMPKRCKLIPEQWLFDVELRQLLVGRRQHKRRVIFCIEGDTVFVVRYEHGSRAPRGESGD